jgi:hypothetical protein
MPEALCMDRLRRCAELAREALLRDEHHIAWLYVGWIEREARERQYEAEWAALDPGER